MNPHIVADGQMRLRTSPEFQAKLRALRKSIRDRYATELASANLLQWYVLQYRIEMEYRRERRRIIPSLHSLYNAAIIAESSYNRESDVSSEAPSQQRFNNVKSI
jgi:hypothetical protein